MDTVIKVDKARNEKGKFVSTKPLDIEEIINIYTVHKKSTLFIGKEKNFSRQQIARILRKNGVEMRKPGGNISRRVYTPEERRSNKRANEHTRRIKSGKALTVKELQNLYEENIKEYGTLTCYLCEKQIEFGQDSIDHILPIAKGGTNDMKNLSIAHKSCNFSKGTKLLEEYKKREL